MVLLRTFFIISILFFHFNMAFSQLVGQITDDAGSPLQFVNIYIENSTTGTSSNSEGNYQLALAPGNYSIVYQFIGYRTVYQNLEIGEEGLRQNIVLQPESYQLKEVTINADGEDPAYAIIRKAQAKRKYYRDLVREYACNVYIKGNQKVLDAPKKIFGMEIGDFDGTLDSNRQGIVYLSESLSRLYYRDGKKKEVLISSKISGDDQGYSFNSAREMEMDFYENTVDIGRDIVTPIASNAMSFYKYKLLGAKMDKNGQLINQIQVQPKQDNLPAFAGEIYIVEDAWNIKELDLHLTEKAIGFPFIDSIHMQQHYVPGMKEDHWVLFSNVVGFRLSGFGFDFKGSFGAVYSDYDFSVIGPGVFNDEIYYVEEEANKKTETYWDSLRPVPLTLEERVDYVRKDSLRLVKESPAYLDSMDRISNAFSIGDILSGYSWQNSRNNSRFNIGSPLSHLSYNTVQGLRAQLDLSWRQALDESDHRSLEWSGLVDYGFSEKEIRPSFKIEYEHDALQRLEISLEGGKQIKQFAGDYGITDFQNLIETLFDRQNYFKAYDRSFIEIGLSRYLGNSIRFESHLSYNIRRPLVNTSEYSFFEPDDHRFTSNNPLARFDLDPFERHQAMIWESNISFRPGQKVYRYPDRKYRIRDKRFPRINLNFKMGINALGSDVDFSFLKLALSDRVNTGVYGNFSYYIAGASFLSSTELYFMDYAHFMANESYDIPSRGTFRFQNMPYYAFFSADKFVQANIEHNFEGFIMDRVPLLKHLQWRLMASARALVLDGNDNYYELSAGFDNVGFSFIRPIQLNMVWRHTDGDSDLNFILGLKFDL